MLLTALSLLLLELSWPPFGFYPLIWVGLIPWFIALKRARSIREAFLSGVLLSFLVNLVGFYWISQVLHDFSKLSWPSAILSMLLYGLIAQPQYFIFAVLWKWLGPRIKNPITTIFFIAFLYTGVEWMVPKLFMDTLGNGLWTTTRIKQAADLGGASLLTFSLFVVNGALWKVWENRKNLRANVRDWRGPVVVAALLVVFLLIYGEIRGNQVRALVASSTRSIRMGVIQANIGNIDKIAAETGAADAPNQVIDRFFELSEAALKQTPKPEVLVWPETSYPSNFRTPHSPADFSLDQRMEGFVASHHISLLFGGYQQEDGKDYNAFFFLSPRKEPSHELLGDLQVYRKNILLFFGEYIPGADTFQFIKKSFPQVGFFGRGEGPEVHTLSRGDPSKPDVPVGPIICYEDLFPNYVIREANQGSQMILNITNDSWFGPRGEPLLHFVLSTLRPIETRLPMVRSTNTGISALILPDGTIEKTTEVGTKEVMNVKVPLTDPIPTLMKKWGDWFGAFSLAMAMIIGAG